jgi:hypothetical protein
MLSNLMNQLLQGVEVRFAIGDRNSQSHGSYGYYGAGRNNNAYFG